MTHKFIPADYTEADYRHERAICDKAHKFMERNSELTPSGGYCLSADKAKHTDYVACNNEMRGRVEQWEILHNPPEKLSAYVGDIGREERERTNLVNCRQHPLIIWTGAQIGTCHLTKKWRVQSYFGREMHQISARIAGVDGIVREYTGRGFGVGMLVNLRETAKSKRARAGKGE